MALDTVITGLSDGPYRELLSGFSNASGLLGDLPGDAWAAYAIPKLGESVQGAFTAFAGPIGGAAIAGQIKKSTGLDLQQDVLSWVGDSGLFVRGSDMSSIDGGLVIEATDEDKAAAAFNKIVGLAGRESGVRPRPASVDGADAAFAFDIPDAPKPILFARGNGRVVAAFGETAAAAGLNPSSKLDDSETLGAAKGALGDMEPIFVLSIPDVVKLVDGMGAADADFEQARPYVEAFGVVTSGSSVDGDKVKSRLAVTLR
jgi:hypothetical protein